MRYVDATDGTGAATAGALEIKGMESVRRDIIPCVQNLLSQVLHELLVARSVPGAVQRTKTLISDLLSGKLDLSQLTVTKALWRGTGAEQYSTKLAHIQLAEKIRKREPGMIAHS